MRHIIYCIVDLIDGALDNIPSYEDGKFYRHGDWGCRIGIIRRFDQRFANWYQPKVNNG